MDVFEYLQQARASQDQVAVERGLKWYLVLHDMLLMGPRRGTHVVDDYMLRV